MPHHDLADLLGNLWPATARDLVVYPQHDDNIAIPAVAEFRAQLFMHAHQPALADDRFAARDNEVQRAVQGAHRHAATVEARQPAMLAGVHLQPFTQAT